MVDVDKMPVHEFAAEKTIKDAYRNAKDDRNYATVMIIAACVMVLATLSVGLYMVTKAPLYILGFAGIMAGVHWAIKKFIK